MYRALFECHTCVFIALCDCSECCVGVHSTVHTIILTLCTICAAFIRVLLHRNLLIFSMSRNDKLVSFTTLCTQLPHHTKLRTIIMVEFKHYPFITKEDSDEGCTNGTQREDYGMYSAVHTDTTL